MRGALLASETKEHNDRSVEAQHVGIGKPANAGSEIAAGDGGNFVDHQARRHGETIFRRRVDWHAEQRRIGRIGGKTAHSDRGRHIEAVILDHHDRARFPGITGSAGGSPDFAAPHRSARSEIASMNA